MQPTAIHKIQKSPAKWRGTGWLFECFQIEIHQSSFFTFIFICKESETAFLIEPNSMSVCIQCNEAASCTISMSEFELKILQNGLPNTLMSIGFGNSETFDFYCGIMCTLFGIRNLAINTITNRLVILGKTYLVIQKTIVSDDVLGLSIYHQVGDSQQFLTIILGIIQKEIVQVIVNALESLQFCVGFQSAKSEWPHTYQSKSAAFLNNSYASRPRSFSASVANVGCSMCQMKRSKSCPSNTGVSFINLAIMNHAFVGAKVQHLSKTASIFNRKKHLTA